MDTTSARPRSDSPTAGSDGSGLRRRALPFREVFAQSLAGTGPSGSLAFGPALVFASAGHGTWISYLLSLLGLLFVGWAFSVFGTRIASAGSMYPYASEGLGPLVGVLVTWALVVAYVVIALVVVAGSGQFFGQFLVLLGWNGAAGTAAQVVMALLIGTAALLFALRDVKISTRAAMVLELISIVCITTVLIATVVKHGVFDSAEFKLHGVSVHGVVLGMVLAITGYVGWAGAAASGAARSVRSAYFRAVFTFPPISAHQAQSLSRSPGSPSERSESSLALASSPGGVIPRRRYISAYSAGRIVCCSRSRVWQTLPVCRR